MTDAISSADAAYVLGVGEGALRQMRDAYVIRQTYSRRNARFYSEEHVAIVNGMSMEIGESGYAACFGSMRLRTIDVGDQIPDLESVKYGERFTIQVPRTWHLMWGDKQPSEVILEIAIITSAANRSVGRVFRIRADSTEGDVRTLDLMAYGKPVRLREIDGEKESRDFEAAREAHASTKTAIADALARLADGTPLDADVVKRADSAENRVEIARAIAAYLADGGEMNKVRDAINTLGRDTRRVVRAVLPLAWIDELDLDVLEAQEKKPIADSLGCNRHYHSACNCTARRFADASAARARALRAERGITSVADLNWNILSLHPAHSDVCALVAAIPSMTGSELRYTRDQHRSSWLRNEKVLLAALVEMHTRGLLDAGSDEAERASDFAAFKMLWNSVVTVERHTQFGDGNQSAHVAFAEACALVGDGRFECFGAFLDLSDPTEESLTSWLWNQLEDEMQDLAKERA